MNIKEYYTVMSKIYLNQVILACLFLIGCFFIFSAVGFMLIFKLIFIAVMTLLSYFFIKYLYFINREGSLTSISADKKLQVANSNELMMMFLPAPSLYIKFFTGNGICKYELRDEKMEAWKWLFPLRIRKPGSQSYQLTKRDGMVLAKIKVADHRGNIEINTHKQQHYILQLIERKRKLLKFTSGDNIILLHITSHKIEVTKDARVIATIHNGWMPIKWQRYFSPNTPILTFKNELNEDELYVIYGLLILLFVNQFN